MHADNNPGRRQNRNAERCTDHRKVASSFDAENSTSGGRESSDAVDGRRQAGLGERSFHKAGYRVATIETRSGASRSEEPMPRRELSLTGAYRLPLRPIS